MSGFDYEIETLHRGVAARYENTKTLYEKKDDVQSLILFENPTFGRILMLDGVTQVTLMDEFIYHEMMSHVPLFSHENPQNILIIGGGDGGIAREVLKHRSVKSVTMVEIDKAVIDFSKKYLPEISMNAFEDPRLDLKITDGAKFVKEISGKYDVIIVDSTDPAGPGEVLFTKEFYQDCHNSLSEKGILVTQNGVPFMQGAELTQSIRFFRDIFNHGICYRSTIPTYVFGEMTMGFASNADYDALDIKTLTHRFDRENIQMRYYTPGVHKASFALPVYIEKLLP